MAAWPGKIIFPRKNGCVARENDFLASKWLRGSGKKFSRVKIAAWPGKIFFQPQPPCLEFVGRIFCRNWKKYDICQRIGNNVEAFRYYLVLESGQFQLCKIIDKWLLRLCLSYILTR